MEATLLRGSVGTKSLFQRAFPEEDPSIRISLRLFVSLSPCQLRSPILLSVCLLV